MPDTGDANQLVTTKHAVMWQPRLKIQIFDGVPIPEDEKVIE